MKSMRPDQYRKMRKTKLKNDLIFWGLIFSNFAVFGIAILFIYLGTR